MRLLLSTSILFSALACSSSSATGGGGAPDPITPACADYARAYCAKLDQCGNKAAQRTFGSVDACVARASMRCVSAAAAPSSGSTAVTIDACTGTIPTASCAEWLEPEPVVCAISPGTLAKGAACAFGTQCASTYCAIPLGAGCGQCAAVPGAGDDCTATRGCGPANLRCDASGSGKCLPLGGASAPCDASAPCLAGLDCVGAEPKKMTQGACQPARATLGAACDPARVAAPGCDRNQGLDCDKASLQCVAVATATAGAPCGYDKTSGAFTICTGGSTCFASAASGATAVCVVAVVEGSACDTAAGPPCLTPARCVAAPGGTSGSCVLVDGASCK